MADWITEIMDSLGILGVALLMFLENVFPPIPSELIMPLAGFSAGRGNYSLLGAIVAGTVGSVLGQYPLYAIGRALGEERLRALFDKHGKWVLVSGDDVTKAAAWFERHGTWAVLLCRLVPGVRSFISIPAGIKRMNIFTFTALSAIGMGAWATALALLGYALGNHYERVSELLGPASAVVFGVIAAALLFMLARRAWHCWRRREEPSTP